MSDDDQKGGSGDAPTNLGDELTVLHAEKDRIEVIRRYPDGFVQKGHLTPMRDGQPINPSAELIQCEALADGRIGVTSIYKAGPPKVATKAFRDGWEATFGNKSTSSN